MRSLFSFRDLILTVDPRVGQIRGLGDQRQVVATEAGGFLPDVAVAVQANDADGMAFPGFRLIPPDAGFDVAESNGVGGLSHREYLSVNEVSWAISHNFARRTNGSRCGK